ncbi:MAG: hypothetical protein WBQ94_02165 [Terracidiphilus sp.]
MVGDGHAVGVAAEVTQDLGGAAEARLGLDESFLLGQLGGQFFEPGRITEMGRRTSAVEPVLAVEMPWSVEELVAEHGAQDGNGQQEHRERYVDPIL